MRIEVSVVEMRRVFSWIWSKKNLVLALSLLWGRQWKTICQLDYSRKNMLFLFSDNHFAEFSITEVRRRQDGILAVPFCQPRVGPSLQIDHGVVISLAPDWWNMLRFVQQLRIYIIIYTYIYIYTVTTFKYVEGGRARPRGPGGSMKYQFVYLNVVTVCINEWDSVCLNGRAGQGKPSGGSLKYLFVY